MRLRGQTKHSSHGDDNRQVPERSGAMSGKGENQAEGRGSTTASPPGTGGHVLPGRPRPSDTQERPAGSIPQAGIQRQSGVQERELRKRHHRPPEQWNGAPQTPPAPASFLCSQVSRSQDNPEHESTYWKPRTAPVSDLASCFLSVPSLAFPAHAHTPAAASEQRPFPRVCLLNRLRWPTSRERGLSAPRSPAPTDGSLLTSVLLSDARWPQFPSCAKPGSPSSLRSLTNHGVAVGLQPASPQSLRGPTPTAPGRYGWRHLLAVGALQTLRRRRVTVCDVQTRGVGF